MGNTKFRLEKNTVEKILLGTKRGQKNNTGPLFHKLPIYVQPSIYIQDSPRFHQNALKVNPQASTPAIIKSSSPAKGKLSNV